MIKKIIHIVLITLPLFSIQTRVINGDTVSDNNDMWRFIVALKNDGEHYCGGSIIKSNWILTAAHCLSDSNGNPNPVSINARIGAGAYNLNEMTEYSIKRYIIHPQYNSNTADNDIALIELYHNISNITPIVYDRSHSLEANTQTMLAGWGNMDNQGYYLYPDDLQEALLPIVDYDICNSPTSYDGELTHNMFCAGYLDGRRDGCQGDSGGPLIVGNTLVGVVSWGEGCAEENFPGVYTKVQNYVSWIEHTIGIPPPRPLPFIPIYMDGITIFVPNPQSP